MDLLFLCTFLSGGLFVFSVLGFIALLLFTEHISKESLLMVLFGIAVVVIGIGSFIPVVNDHPHQLSLVFFFLLFLLSSLGFNLFSVLWYQDWKKTTAEK